MPLGAHVVPSLWQHRIVTVSYTHLAITWNMQIVFYTAYDKYMIYAIRGAAFDYLLKPIDQKELEGIIDRFMKKAEEDVYKRQPLVRPGYPKEFLEELVKATGGPVSYTHLDVYKRQGLVKRINNFLR